MSTGRQTPDPYWRAVGLYLGYGPRDFIGGRAEQRMLAEFGPGSGVGRNYTPAEIRSIMQAARRAKETPFVWGFEQDMTSLKTATGVGKPDIGRGRYEGVFLIKYTSQGGYTRQIQVSIVGRTTDTNDDIRQKVIEAVNDLARLRNSPALQTYESIEPIAVFWRN